MTNMLRQKFCKLIEELIDEHKELTTQEMYDLIKTKHPELCNESILCTCGNKKTNVAEWKHIVRWSQQDLKYLGRISLHEKVWS